MPDPSPLDYGRRPGPRQFHLSRWIVYPVLAVILFLVLDGVLIPSGTRSREVAMRARCLSAMHQIGLAVNEYAQDHGGTYPDSLATLVREVPDFAPEVLVCGDSRDTPAAGPTTRAVADAVAAGGHCSYVYAGAGLTVRTVTPTTIVAYEPVPRHGGGGDVLYGDGHAAWMAAAALPSTASPAVSPSPGRTPTRR